MKTTAKMTWEDSVVWLQRQPNMAELVTACYFDDPLLAAAQRFHESAEWQQVRSFLPPPGKAIDIGAGRGITSFALASDGWDVVAVEPDNSDIVGGGAIRKLVRETGLPIMVLPAFAEDLPLPDNSFDAVVCRQALHHAEDLPRFCKEATRVLKPGGAFIATREHVIDNHGEHLQAFLEGHPLHFLYGGENAYLLSEYLGAITEAGVNVTRVLNPWESEINTFPLTRQDIKRSIVSRFKVPFPFLVPDFVVNWLGGSLSAPGRLYSFIGIKKLTCQQY